MNETKTIIDVPFTIGEEVWVWENCPIFREKSEVIWGYDHLGAYEERWTECEDYFKPVKYKFHFGLLDKYDISKIFKSREDCKKYGDSLSLQ